MKIGDVVYDKYDENKTPMTIEYLKKVKSETIGFCIWFVGSDIRRFPFYVDELEIIT